MNNSNPFVSHSPQAANVVVEAPARLHMGFLDLHGGLGRRFGSVGLALEGLSTIIRAKLADDVAAHAPIEADSERAQRCVETVLERLSVPTGVHIEVSAAIPHHAGLGSGTQLSLAIGAAIKALFGLDLTTLELAQVFSRGERSGIGLGAFDAGGFLVDGGRGKNQLPPPVVARAEFPSTWRTLLIFDRERQGLHGERESEAFLHGPRFAEDKASHLCRLTLMRIIPALVEHDFTAFTRGVGELQRAAGEHFSHAQGGAFNSPEVGRILDEVREAGFEGVGQSSWGPTGFVIVDSVRSGRTLLAELRQRFGEVPNLDFKLVGGRNSGHRVTIPQERSQQTKSTRIQA